MKNNKKLYLAILSLLLLIGNASFAAKEKKYVLSSPDGTLKVEISAGNELAYQVMHGNDTILSHSNIGLVLENGTIVGKTPRITGERRRKIKDNIESPFYRFKEFVATGNELDLKLKGGFGIIFRAYNEGVAYRFYTTQSSDIIIKEEQAEFNFKEDYTAYLPYTTNDKKPMAMAYQNVYDIIPLSKAQPKLAFLPVTVDCGSVKLTLLESDLEAYPGMFVQSQQGKYGLKGSFEAGSDGHIWAYTLSKASKHDIKMVEDLLRQYRCQYILADQGYLSNELKKKLEKEGIWFWTPSRKNMKEKKQENSKFLKKKRKYIETVFSKLVNLFDIERIRVQSILGFRLRLEQCLLVYTIKNELAQ